MPPPRTGEKGEVVASDRKRPWVKPSIRSLRMMATRTGTEWNSANDEDRLIADPASHGPDHVARYAPTS